MPAIGMRNSPSAADAAFMATSAQTVLAGGRFVIRRTKNYSIINPANIAHHVSIRPSSNNAGQTKSAKIGFMTGGECR